MKKPSVTEAVCAMTVIAACLLFCANIGKTTGTGVGAIIGSVVDSATGAALRLVAVQIEGEVMGALTSSEGRYRIAGVPEGEYSVRFSLIGYKTAVVTDVEVVADSTIELNAVLTALPKSAASDIDVLCKVEVKDVQEISLPTVGIIRRYGELHIRAGRSSEIPFIVDGIETKDLLGGVGPAYARTRSVPYSTSRVQPVTRGMAHGGTTPPNAEAYDAMFFEHYGVNPFVSTEDDNLSTFAVDIDDASFIMARTYLHDGNLPPKEAVRVEEFVNHFDYGYEAPEKEPLGIFIHGAPSPFGQGYELLKIGLKGRVIPPEGRKPAVLTFVVDVSSSMDEEDRIVTVRKALRMLVDQLRGDDLVGIVAYDSDARVVLRHTSIENKEEIIAAIESLDPSGCTNAEAGIVLGYKLAEESFVEGATNRIVLCSDGVANVGLTGADGILKRIEKQVKKGITLSSIGFGLGNYNDVLLEKLGNKGNGYYAYVDNLQDAKKIFIDNLTGSLEVIARDVKIQVEFDTSQVDRYRLLGFENRDVEDDKFRDDTVDGGEIGSGHSCTALYELKLKGNATGRIGTFSARFKNPDNDEVTEISREIDGSDFKGSFDDCESGFKLAAAAAEFAEIMRDSYWARGSTYAQVLEIARGMSDETRDRPDVIEFIDLVSRASNLKAE